IRRSARERVQRLLPCRGRPPRAYRTPAHRRAVANEKPFAFFPLRNGAWTYNYETGTTDTEFPPGPTPPTSAESFTQKRLTRRTNEGNHPAPQPQTLRAFDAQSTEDTAPGKGGQVTHPSQHPIGAHGRRGRRPYLITALVFVSGVTARAANHSPMQAIRPPESCVRPFCPLWKPSQDAPPVNPSHATPASGGFGRRSVITLYYVSWPTSRDCIDHEIGQFPIPAIGTSPRRSTPTRPAPSPSATRHSSSSPERARAKRAR